MENEIPSFEDETKSDNRLEQLRNISDIVRSKAFETVLEAKNGHLGGCSSSVELMTTLYFGGYLEYDPNNSKNPNRDIVLIRGHEGPLRYSIFSIIGFIEEADLHTYRRFGSKLQGHEDMFKTPGVDISPNGSLGMLLSYGVGAAIERKRNNKDNNIIVFLGDGEEQEGNVSEAARNAATLELNNLIVIIDQNGKQLSRETSHSDGKTDLPSLWKAYGWDILEIQNGHDLSQIDEVYDAVFHSKRKGPTCIIAHTVKGITLPNVENNFSGAHTIGAYNDNESLKKSVDYNKNKVIKRGFSEKQIYEIGKKIAEENSIDHIEVKKVENKLLNINIEPTLSDDLVPSHTKYYRKLGEIIENNPDNMPNFYFLTPDLFKKPLVEQLQIENIGQMLDLGIREQHVMATTHGLSIMDPNARITLFMGDAFAYRFMDQLNATAQGRSKTLILAEKAGLCQAKNGLSHQSVGQPLAVLGIPNVEFYEPADTTDFYNILNYYYSQNPGLMYARLHNKKFKGQEIINLDLKRNLSYYIAYEPKKSQDLTIVSSGFPLCNAVQASKILENNFKVGSRVINIINPKSLDKEFNRLIKDSEPLLVLYNGNVDTLIMPISKSLLGSGINPSSVHSVGYEIGTTGSLNSLEKHFKLDEESIINTVININSSIL
jgi:transketolase